MFGRADVSMETSHVSGISNQRLQGSVEPSHPSDCTCTFIQLAMREDAMGGILLKLPMGSAGADVRRLDAGTSLFQDSVRFLGQSANFLRYICEE